MKKVLSIDIDYCFPSVDDWPNDNNELWEEWHPYTKWTQYFTKYTDLNDRSKIIDEAVSYTHLTLPTIYSV